MIFLFTLYSIHLFHAICVTFPHSSYWRRTSAIGHSGEKSSLPRNLFVQIFYLEIFWVPSKMRHDFAGCQRKSFGLPCFFVSLLCLIIQVKRLLLLNLLLLNISISIFIILLLFRRLLLDCVEYLLNLIDLFGLRKPHHLKSITYDWIISQGCRCCGISHQMIVFLRRWARGMMLLRLLKFLNA